MHINRAQVAGINRRSGQSAIQQILASAEFWAPLNDLGAGAVDTTLAHGTGSATFTRATTATTVNSAGLIVGVASGVARSMYDPTSLAYLGYLAEGARTNLMPQSEAFSAADWTKNAATIGANAAVAPDGASTADKLVADNGAVTTGNDAVGSVTQGETVSAAAAWTLSLFAKAAELNSVKLREGVATGAIAVVSLTDGSVTYDAGSAANMAVTSQEFPGGWWRIFATRTTGGAETSCTVNIKPDIDTGDGTSGVYIWGAQLEQASFASSYIPTTTASVTRNADSLTYAASGNIDTANGTAYAELSSLWSSADGSVAVAIGTAATNAGPLHAAPGSTEIRMSDATTAVQKNGLTDMKTGIRKRASSWGGSGQSITGDGAAPATGVFDDTMVTSDIGIGQQGDGSGQHWFGTIRNARIWNRQLTDSQLQAMTA